MPCPYTPRLARRSDRKNNNMRILHTSDWHLGQSFMGKTRLAEHQAFLDWLIGQVQAHQVDAVIIAGDVFDTGTPPSYARELYNSFVSRMHDSGATLVVLGGNHDSVATLGESRALFSKLGTHVVPGVAAIVADQVLVLPDQSGRPGALLCAVPFVRAREVVLSEAGQTAEQKQQALQAAIRRHYHDVYELALARRAALGGTLPIVATGHLTTVGASLSESVREIYVGTLAAFPASEFPPADYIALGHIHRPQKVGGQEHIRYCGSPIPLSFDEARTEKEVVLVELADGGLKSVTPVTVPTFQQLVSLTGSLVELESAFAELAVTADPGRPVWAEVVVASDDYLSDLQERLQAMIEDKPIEILRTRRERGQAAATWQQATGGTLDELTPHQVFAHRLDAEQLDDVLRGELELRHRLVLGKLEETEA
ncbi:MAG: nuclease SbcCD, subunit [Moraxellaceae bacterium]|jgi:exonuclease SbcD|nr:nuclease SbcCD, subunit [Moraxellaceae bacterium]